MPTTKGGAIATIQVGKWINFESVFNDGICDAPRQVTRCSAARIWYANPKEGAEAYRLISSVVFVSDTLVEAEALYKVSMDQVNELRKVRAAHQARIDAVIGGSIAKTNDLPTS